MKSSVRPASGPPCATVSTVRTVVVPTASTACAAAIRCQAGVAHLVPLAVDVVLLDDVGLQRPERVEPDVQGDSLDVESREQLIA